MPVRPIHRMTRSRRGIEGTVGGPEATSITLGIGPADGGEMSYRNSASDPCTDCAHPWRRTIAERTDGRCFQPDDLVASAGAPATVISHHTWNCELKLIQWGNLR